MKKKKIDIEGFCALYDTPTIYRYKERKGCYSSADGSEVPIVNDGIFQDVVGHGQIEERDTGLYFVGTLTEDIDLHVTPHYLVANRVNKIKGDREVQYGEIDYVWLSQTVDYPRTEDYVRCVAREVN